MTSMQRRRLALTVEDRLAEHADSSLANDVRCTHAASIAQIDLEQLYYLRSRGLRLDKAKRLVIESFLEVTVERFEQGFVREAIARALERRLEPVLGCAGRRRRGTGDLSATGYPPIPKR